MNLELIQNVLTDFTLWNFTPSTFIFRKDVSHNFMLTFTDLLTVSETAAEPPQDEGSSLNSPRNLALEATFINHNFSQQVLKRKLKLRKKNHIKEISLISNE